MATNSQMLPGMSIQRLSDEDGHDHIRLTFPRTGERGRGELLQSIAILGQPTALRSALWTKGYKVPTSMTATQIAHEVEAQLPDVARPLFTKSGWVEHGAGTAFAFPDKLVGPIDAEVIVGDSVKAHSIARGGQAGSLSDWQTTVAAIALRSQVACLAIMTALASPLLRYSGLTESFTLNIAGESSSGKSTAVAAAISVWGSPKNCLNWDVTDGGLGNILVANSGLGLFLDDVEKQSGDLDARIERVRQVIHKIVAGRTRTYATMAERDSALRSQQYECIAFCSSPVTIEKFSRNARKPLLKSDRVRFLEVEVPSGDDGGIFATPAKGRAAPNSRELATQLKLAAETNYGKAGRKWIRYLVKHAVQLPQHVASYSEQFLDEVGKDVAAVEGRIADKFALVFSAGMIAQQSGILPWDTETIKRIALRGYRDAISAGFPDRFDADRALLRVKELLMDRHRLHRPSRKLNQLRKGSRDGYVVDGHLYLRSDVFEQTLRDPRTGLLPSASDLDHLYEDLAAAGCLLAGHGNRTRNVWIAGAKQRRLVFNLAKLSKEFRRRRRTLGLPEFGNQLSDI